MRRVLKIIAIVVVSLFVLVAITSVVLLRSNFAREKVRSMLENAIAEGHKVLVFSQFVKHLDLVKQYLKSNKIDFAYLDGSSTDRACCSPSSRSRRRIDA